MVANAFPVNTGVITAGGITFDTPMMVVPGLSAGAYATGDQVGTIMSVALPNGIRSGILQKIVIMDRDKQSLALDVVLCDGLVTLAADNAAATFSDAEHLKLLGTVSLVATDYVAWATESTATKNNVGFTFRITDPTGLQVTLVTRAAPTYVPTMGLGIRLGFLLDAPPNV